MVAAWVGCARKPDPSLAPTSGTVTLGGKPLPGVLVRFTPSERGINAEWISEDIADDAGRFELTSPRGSGAVVGRHRVTVSEGTVPDDVREDQAKVAAWMAKLSGRPLPEIYGTTATSPLEATVEASGSVITIELNR